ncbi:MAG: ATP-binding protein, partial [Gammaproteobacteria bacterium]
MEAIGRLAGGVAHDFNNLLAPIIGYSELLTEDSNLDDKQKQSLSEILHAGLRARNLVRQLLAFCRKQTLESRPLNLNETIKNFGELLQSTIPENIELKQIFSPDILPVMADVDQIERIIMNLAVNAADAMPNGGELTIETSVSELGEEYTATHPDLVPGSYVMLAMHDTGCGMDHETRDHIFEPFFSTKGELGTGLGLATVFGIVKQHGGSIWLHSEPGQGTMFKIYLPVTDEAPVKKKTRTMTVTDPKANECILLVDDDEQMRHLVQTILERQGYTVFSAKDSDDALATLASHQGPIHLLLTDVVMPGINGRELYKQATLDHPDLKVLYMSGYTDNIIVHHGVLDKGIQFIQKPFSNRDLIYKIRETLKEPE